MAENPYEAPKSNVELSPGTEGGGSLAGAIAGNYDFEIMEVIKEGWEKVHGFKLTSCVAFICYIGIIIALAIVFEVAGAALGAQENTAFILISQLLQNIVGYPLWVGLTILGIHRAAGLPTSYSHVFKYFNKIIPLFLLGFLMTLLIILGMICLIIPGIYLAFAFIFALPLLAEKQLGIVEALQSSRKAVTHHWFKIAGFYLLLMLIFMLGAITFIGLIWVIPLMLSASGVLYHKMFGTAGA